MMGRNKKGWASVEGNQELAETECERRESESAETLNHSSSE